MDHPIALKTKEEIAIMHEGGQKLAQIRDSLAAKVAVGVSALDIETLANELIRKTGGSASFKMVPGYSWATCISINEAIVHGIPKKANIFKSGDVVSIDVGLFYKGFHTDTSTSVAIDPTPATQKFLLAGQNAIKEAIAKCVVGNKVYDLSLAMQKNVESAGYSPVTSLVGHGVGRFLHEEPAVPCVAFEPRERSVTLSSGLVLAIEIMYGAGTGDVVKADDGWTLVTADGRISGLFEETVAVTADGPFILTKLT